MSMLLEIHPEPGFLHVLATGIFSLEEAKRTFLQLLEAIALHQSNKALVDGRNLVGEPTTMERFYYGDFAAQTVASFAKRGAPRAIQFAYVLREPVLDQRRFGETVAANRGMWVKMFDSHEEALLWLGIPPANKADASDTVR